MMQFVERKEGETPTKAWDIPVVSSFGDDCWAMWVYT